MTRIFLFAISFFLVQYAHSQTGELIVIIKGVNSIKGGQVSTGIFPKEGFPKPGQQIAGLSENVSGKEMKMVFSAIPIGTYGVVAYQDIDKNGELKKNFIGYPTEPLGFSRDARIRTGPPDFDDASVVVEANKTLTITITLR